MTPAERRIHWRGIIRSNLKADTLFGSLFVFVNYHS